MNLVSIILLGIVGLVIGGALGFLFGSRGTSNAKKSLELQEKFASTEHELQQYRQEVTSHFHETAKLVDDLTEAYRNVHNHLAVAASELTPSTLEQPLLKTLPDKEEMDAMSSAPIAADIHAPLDYAPKTPTSRVGMLDESYGLEKEAAPQEETEQDVIAAN